MPIRFGSLGDGQSELNSLLRHQDIIVSHSHHVSSTGHSTVRANACSLGGMVSSRLRLMAMRGAPLTGRHGRRLRTAADHATRICGYMRLP